MIPISVPFTSASEDKKNHSLQSGGRYALFLGREEEEIIREIKTIYEEGGLYNYEDQE